MAVRVVDYSALNSPATAADVAAYRAQAKASGAAWARWNPSSAVALLSIMVFVVFFLFTFGGLALSGISGLLSGDTGGLGRILAPLVFLVVIVFVVATVAHRALTGGGVWARRLRLARFAAANGMTYSPQQGDPGYPGEIFQLGRDRVALDHLATSSGRFLDMGNFRWITGSGRSQTTHTWGFLAMALDRNMPNIVLDSRANNSLFGSNLPAVLDRNQVLHLEGDFDRYFTLYCPAEYEQDALYIFTPDLMALLIDTAAPFDVELVDEWMFVYSSKPFDLTKQPELQRLFTIADTVGTKTLTQTDHYADARVGDFDANIVAPQGARLKHGVSVIGIAVVAIFVLVWGWSVFGNLFGG